MFESLTPRQQQLVTDAMDRAATEANLTLHSRYPRVELCECGRVSARQCACLPDFDPAWWPDGDAA